MNAQRPLGRVEDTFERLNRLATTWTIATVSCVEGALTVELLHRAMAIACARHPRLNCRIVGEPGRLHFATGGEVLLRMTPAREPEDWQAVVEAELNEPIAAELGLIRVHLVPGPASTGLTRLITVTHHAISDGLSCMHLHCDVLTCCGYLALGEAPPALAPLPALPPIEGLAPEYFGGLKHWLRGWWFLLKTGCALLQHQPTGLPIEKYAPVKARRTGLVPRVLEADFTRILVRRCRFEKTSVQAALSAALLIAVSRRLDPVRERTVRLTSQSYLNLRRFLTPPLSNDHLAPLASASRHHYAVTPATDFWELARQVKRDLEATLQSRELFTIVGVTWPMFKFLFLFPRQRAFSTSVSNVGRVEIPDRYDPFVLKQIGFASSHGLLNGALAANVATFQDTMTINFNYSMPALSRRTVEVVVEAVVAQLCAAVREPYAQLRN
jgi:hypothetical protein